MKKLFIRIAGALVLLVIVAVVVLFFSLNSIVKKGVETVGPSLTKVNMGLKRANLSPLSGKGQLTGLFIGNPEGYKTPSAITVGDVQVALQVSSVLSDTIKIDLVHIEAPEITLEGSLSGNNLSKILDNLNAATGGEKAAKKPDGTSQKSEKKFIIKDVLVKGGKVHLSITALGGQALTVPLPEVHVQDIGTRENGVDAAEASKQIMAAVLGNVQKAAGEAVAGVGKGVQDLGKSAVEKVQKTTTDTLKNLLPK